MNRAGTPWREPIAPADHEVRTLMELADLVAAHAAPPASGANVEQRA
jgi:hypothetical protein